MDNMTAARYFKITFNVNAFILTSSVYTDYNMLQYENGSWLVLTAPGVLVLSMGRRSPTFLRDADNRPPNWSVLTLLLGRP